MGNRTFNDLATLRFGRLTVVSRATPVGHKERGRSVAIRWHCLCDCGNTSVVSSSCLRGKTNPTQSCGCLRGERTAEAVRTHGAYKTTEYRIWQNMIARCENPNQKFYRHYGGRGVKVCPRWRNSFSAFLEDMGVRPSAQHTLDRTDNDGDYTPENCRWATRLEQQKNRRNSRLITFRNRTETAHMWSKITGIPSRTVTNRLNRGWSPERILTTPAARANRGGKSSD